MPGSAVRTVGADLQTRQAARRQQLLAVGITLLGDAESPGVTVRAVCRGSGLTERYFYESFADRDEFARAVYDEVGGRAHAALVQAVQHSSGRPSDAAHAAVEAFVTLMVDEPAMGRVLLIAPLVEFTLSSRAMTLMPAFVDLVRAQLSDSSDAAEQQMVAIGVVGALSNLFIGYLNGTLRVSRERFVEHCAHLVVGAHPGALA